MQFRMSRSRLLFEFILPLHEIMFNSHLLLMVKAIECRDFIRELLCAKKYNAVLLNALSFVRTE